MKILLLTREFPPHTLGGISYYLSFLCDELVARGHDVTVVTGTCWNRYDETRMETETTVEVHTVHFGFREGYYVAFPVALRTFLRNFETSEFDVAMTHTQVPFELGLPTVAMHHDSVRETRPYLRQRLPWHHRIADSVLHPARCWIDQRALDVADHAMFNSDLCRKAWKKHYSIPCETTVSHNGVDMNQFYPRDVASNEKYVLFVGDIERKGLSTVIEYARESALPVYFVGPSEVAAPNTTGLGRVEWDELPRLYSGASVTVHPAKFEAFGNVVLESLACGTPVVTSDRCGAAEVVTDECAVITDNLQHGVERALALDGDDCVATAMEHPWSRVANETVSVLQTVQ